MIDKFTGNVLRFKDYLLDMITRPSNTSEYNLLLLEEQPATEPTYSVVELPQHPDQPVPEEAIIYNYVPSVPVEPVEPIQSVVEVHQPRNLAAPDPEEVANSLYTHTWCSRGSPSQRERKQLAKSNVSLPRVKC